MMGGEYRASYPRGEFEEDGAGRAALGVWLLQNRREQASALGIRGREFGQIAVLVPVHLSGFRVPLAAGRVALY